MPSFVFISGPSGPSYLEITGLSLTTAINVELHVVGAVVDTDDADLALRVYTGGVLNTDVADYQYYQFQNDSAGATGVEQTSSSDGYFLLTAAATGDKMSNTSGDAYSAIFRIDNPAASVPKRISFDACFETADGRSAVTDGVLKLNDTAAITGFRLYSPSGASITAGSMYIVALEP